MEKENLESSNQFLGQLEPSLPIQYQMMMEDWGGSFLPNCLFLNELNLWLIKLWCYVLLLFLHLCERYGHEEVVGATQTQTTFFMFAIFIRDPTIHGWWLIRAIRNHGLFFFGFFIVHWASKLTKQEMTSQRITESKTSMF